MKKSTSKTTERASKGPVRAPSLGQGPSHQGTSSQALYRKSSIPVPHVRSSSADRLSRNVVDLSTKKPRRSKSVATVRGSATPQCNQIQRTSSLSGSTLRNRSAERQRFVTVAAGAKRGDTRPINDKAFQKKSMERVYRYFQDQPPEFAGLCPPPPFKSFLINNFIEMIQYLIRQFFPDAKINSFNYVTEVPCHMKKLGYPGNLTSSWLKSVNTPHAWCHVVATLSWVTDLLIYKDTSMDDGLHKYFKKQEDDIVNPKTFFHYVYDSFVPWNKCDDARLEELDSQFIGNIASGNITKEKLDALQADVDAMQKLLDNPAEQAEMDEEKVLEEELTNLQIKNQHFKDTTAKKNSDVIAFKQELEDVSKKMETFDKEASVLEEERNQLDLAIATQEMTVPEAEAVKAECMRLETQYLELEQYHQNIAKAIYATEIKMAGKQKELNKLCVEYNTKVLADFIDNKELIIDTDYYHSDNLEEQWLQADKDLENLVLRLKQELKRVQQKNKERACDAAELEQKKLTLLKERDSLKKEVDEKKHALKMIKEEFEAKETELNNRLLKAKSEIEALKNSMPDVEASRKNLLFQQERTERLKQEVVLIQERSVIFIERLMEIIKKSDDARAARIAAMTKLNFQPHRGLQ